MQHLRLPQAAPPEGGRRRSGRKEAVFSSRRLRTPSSNAASAEGRRRTSSRPSPSSYRRPGSHRRPSRCRLPRRLDCSKGTTAGAPRRGSPLLSPKSATTARRSPARRLTATGMTNRTNSRRLAHSLSISPTTVSTTSARRDRRATSPTAKSFRSRLRLPRVCVGTPNGSAPSVFGSGRRLRPRSQRLIHDRPRAEQAA